MTITVGVNSYITSANADTYMAEALHGDAWNNAVSTIKEKALVTAARMLDRQRWQGTKTDPAQAMQWPRQTLFYEDGSAVDTSSVPARIINGQCELALALIQDLSTQTNRDNTQNIRKLQAGPVDVEFFRITPGGRFPTIVQELIGFFLAGSAVIPAPTATGICTESFFDDHVYDWFTNVR